MSDLSKRVETDVNAYRLRLAALPEGVVVFAWDYPGSTLLRVRIIRTELDGSGLGEGVDPRSLPSDPDLADGAGSRWRAVYDAESGSFRDHDVEPGRAYRYAVFARNGTDPWVLWRDQVVEVPVSGTS